MQATHLVQPNDVQGVERTISKHTPNQSSKRLVQNAGTAGLALKRGWGRRY